MQTWNRSLHAGSGETGIGFVAGQGAVPLVALDDEMEGACARVSSPTGGRHSGRCSAHSG
ncbi:hypothetical protein GCM10009547_49240 [Sporichthya brevicatena]|uniref:Uncharacterized protein n=1 Tax=Sporichthya brevicatena TaxID=171442 RepID=A0ABN1HDA0_9ACTN